MGYFSKERREYRSLLKAIRARDMDMLKALIARGAPLSPPDDAARKASPPVLQAVQSDFIDAIPVLVAAGANVNERSVESWSHPLFYAAANNNKPAVTALLDLGADTEYRGYSGKTPLFEALSYSYDSIITHLVERGANINTQQEDGQTPLHYAARYGQSGRVRMLLALGADPNITDKHMNTAADVAEKDYPKVAEMIREMMQPKAAPPEAPQPGWQIVAQDEVARVIEKRGIGYRVTETFNFSARLYTHITQNMATGAESQSVKHFDELGGSDIVGVAEAALKSLGGNPGDVKRKPVLPQPGAVA